MTRECWIKWDRILRSVDRVAWISEAFGLTFALKKILRYFDQVFRKIVASNIGNGFDMF